MGGEFVDDKLTLARTLLLALADSIGDQYDRDTGEALAYVAEMISDAAKDMTTAEENTAKA